MRQGSKSCAMAMAKRIKSERKNEWKREWRKQWGKRMKGIGTAIARSLAGSLSRFNCAKHGSFVYTCILYTCRVQRKYLIKITEFQRWRHYRWLTNGKLVIYCMRLVFGFANNSIADDDDIPQAVVACMPRDLYIHVSHAYQFLADLFWIQTENARLIPFHSIPFHFSFRRELKWQWWTNASIYQCACVCLSVCVNARINYKS